VYIDRLLGIPTFWKQTVEGRTDSTIGTFKTNGVKLGLTKEGKICSQLGGISDLSTKCYPKWQIEVLATTALPKTTKSSAPSNDIQSRLSKLKKLLDAGLITKEEAAKKRKAILDSL
jgi:hypothetical protein